MPEDYPLKPTDADLDDESVERQDAVMAWQSEEPVLVVKTPEDSGIVAHLHSENALLRSMCAAVADERDKYRAALERLAEVDPLVEDNLPLIDTNREFEARIRFAEAALKGEP